MRAQVNLESRGCGDLRWTLSQTNVYESCRSACVLAVRPVSQAQSPCGGLIATPMGHPDSWIGDNKIRFGLTKADALYLSPLSCEAGRPKPAKQKEGAGASPLLQQAVLGWGRAIMRLLTTIWKTVTGKVRLLNMASKNGHVEIPRMFCVNLHLPRGGRLIDRVRIKKSQKFDSPVSIGKIEIVGPHDLDIVIPEDYGGGGMSIYLDVRFKLDYRKSRSSSNAEELLSQEALYEGDEKAS
jgi:hypothetical protein